MQIPTKGEQSSNCHYPSFDYGSELASLSLGYEIFGGKCFYKAVAKVQLQNNFCILVHIFSSIFLNCILISVPRLHE